MTVRLECGYKGYPSENKRYGWCPFHNEVTITMDAALRDRRTAS